MSGVNAATRVAGSIEPPAAQREKVKDAASDFEALLIAQMLRSARSAASLTSLDGESGSSDAVIDFAEQQLSEALASAGGLGLATLVTEGLSTAEAKQVKKSS
jgi:Rod binding domain-containing protein